MFASHRSRSSLSSLFTKFMGDLDMKILIREEPVVLGVVSLEKFNTNKAPTTTSPPSYP